MPSDRSLLRTLGRLQCITFFSASLSACLSSTLLGPSIAEPSSVQTISSETMESIVFTKISEGSINKIQFSQSGEEVLIATSGDVMILETDKFALLKRITPSDALKIRGYGFIDNKHFYIGYAARGAVPFKVFSLGTWDEIFSYEFESGADTSVWANQNFVNYGSILVNWRTGQKFETESFSRSRRVHLSHNNHLIFAEYNGWVRIDNPQEEGHVEWDAGNGKSVQFLIDTTDNNFLITISINGFCRVWERGPKPVATGNCGEGSNSAIGKQQSMYFLPKKNRLATSNDSKVQIYQIDEKTGNAVLNMEINAQHPVLATAVSNRDQVAISTEDGRIELWDLPNMQRTATYQPKTSALGARQLEFSPDGNTLLVGLSNYLIALKVPQ